MRSQAVFHLAIQETRKRFGEPPRTFGFFERMYLKIKPPAWMASRHDTRFLKLYEQQNLLYQAGVVVWGHIIQANTLLFKGGDCDCPAAIAYSLDKIIDRRPEILGQVAHLLYSVKGKNTDKDLQLFSEKLADEMVADWKVPIPARLTGGIQCFYITTMVIRKHLPNKFLSGQLFPFLVCPEQTDVGLILPGRYWAKGFKQELW